jgi:hypothetical protein
MANDRPNAREKGRGAVNGYAGKDSFSGGMPKSVIGLQIWL